MPLPIDTPTLLANARALLDWLSETPARPCRMCGKTIWLIRDPKTGVVRPFTEAAANHNFDCPGAERYRQEQAAQRSQSSLFPKHPEAL